MIVHNYHESPYAEKIRAMLGYTGLPWQSVDVPPQPPRPSLDPLLGGYRRIPVMQDGADLYCDSNIIASEIATRTNHPELALENADDETQAFVEFVESDIFAAAIFAAPKGTMLFKMLRHRGFGFFKFMADRVKASKDGNLGNVTPEEAKDVWANHMDDMERRFTQSGADFLGGLTPNIADFAAYHTVWVFNEQAGGAIFGAAVQRWQERMAAFGHGTSTPLSIRGALDAAKNAEPKPVPAAQTQGALIGKPVCIAPNDYMRDATEGTLVGESPLQWTLARQTTRAGLIHAHFPKAGYDISG